jgi:hypothetical protein
MAFVSLIAELEAATSLLDLATRLGRVCLAEERLLTRIRNRGEAVPQRRHLEREVASIGLSEWRLAPQGGFAHVLDAHGLRPVIKHVATYPPLEHLAFVRGLCSNALTAFFEEAKDEILLEQGMPVCFATRPVNKYFEAVTPFQQTLGGRGLLRGLNYGFFRHSTTEAVRVTLDFRRRRRLDEVTWSGKRHLPCVATLHPFLGDGHLDFSVSGATVFDVKPKRFSLEEVLDWLRSVRHHQIAILPELCLPCPDALGPSLAAAPSDYPPLIVAGSAHVRRTSQAEPLCINESCVYLDGELVHVHHKLHPLETRRLGDSRFEDPISEGITDEPKDLVVLSGERTRLAVVICADLNDGLIPMLLEEAGVNLLLVPALTYSAGAFTGAVCGLASRCQAICVVANAGLEATTKPSGKANPPPFLVLASVPRPEPQEQSRSYRDPSNPALPRGVFDPNMNLAQAMFWDS